MKYIIIMSFMMIAPYVLILLSSNKAYTKELEEQRKRELEDDEYYDTFK